MTDNEIITALECCTGIRKVDSCSKCPACVGCNDCVDILREDALDLINRQKAEIDRLNIELQAMRGAANSYKAELEEKTRRLKGILPIVAQLKTEVVNEFTARVKEKLHYAPTVYQSYFLRIVDATAKEMEGEENERT